MLKADPRTLTIAVRLSPDKSFSRSIVFVPDISFCSLINPWHPMLEMEVFNGNLLTKEVSNLRKRDRSTEIDRRLRRDRGVLPIRHPLSRNKDTHGRQVWTNQRPANSNAQRQHGGRVAMPAHRPVSFCRAQVPFAPKVKCENRLKLKCILRRTVGRRVCKGHRVLCDETGQQSRNTGVNRAECRTGLPRALASAFRGGGGNTKVGPTPIKRLVFCRSGQGSTATSNTGRSPNSVRVPPRELGTVTNANVGRINCAKGSKDAGGMRGINGRMKSWLVS